MSIHCGSAWASPLAAVLAFTVPVLAQDPTTPSRLERLETEFEEFKALLRDNAETGFEASEFQSSEPTLRIRGFGHVSYAYDSMDLTGGPATDTNNFALGGLDLFLTSQLTDRVSFLNETVFEFATSGEAILDIERVIVKYEVNDSIFVQAGRFHTKMGYWNETYHHGEYLQTSIGRPAVLRFEDDGGLLPVHSVGLGFGGRLESSAGEFALAVEVSNGRGAIPDNVQIVTDANDNKAININVGFQPASIPGLEVSGGAYFDKIPPNADVSAGPLHGTIDEMILSASLVYVRGPWEIFGEFYQIDHDQGSGSSAQSLGHYVQLGYRTGSWVPYMRYEGVMVADNDLFYASLSDSQSLALGLRWDVGRNNAIKLQLSGTDNDASPTGTDSDDLRAELQWSFAF